MEQNSEVRNSGIILIILGLIHFVLAGLEFTWGVVLVLLGIVSLFYQSRKMLPAFGVVVILAGLLNIIGTGLSNTISRYWLFFGCIQILLGVSELYGFYKPTNAKPEKGFVKIEGEESILKSVLRLIFIFFLIIIIGAVAYFLTTRTEINEGYVLWPILVGGLFASIFFGLYNISTVRYTYKINSWPYEKVVMNEPYLKKLKRQRPVTFYSILGLYILITAIVCGLLIINF